MASNLAAGVDIIERHFSQRVEAVGTIAYGTLGVFSKGPVNERRRITSESQMVTVFGKPTKFSAPYFLAISAILDQAPVEVVRVEDGEVSCAGFTVGLSGGQSAAISTPVDVLAYPLTYDSIFTEQDGVTQIQVPNGLTNSMTFLAVGPGEVYNNVQVAVINSADYEAISQFRSSLADAITPTQVQTIAQTTYNLALSGSGMSLSLAEDLIDINASFQVDTQQLDEYLAFENGPSAADEFGVYEYVSGTLQNTYLVSVNPDKKDRYAKSMFANRVIGDTSENIKAFVGTSRVGAVSVAPASIAKTNLSGASILSSSASVLTDELYQQLNANFYSKEDVELAALVDLDFPVAIKQRMVEICEARKDCVAILNVAADTMINLNTEQKTANQTTLIKQWTDNVLNINSSYAALYANYFKVYDQYNDEERWIPCTGHIARQYAFTVNSFDVWSAVAGLERGLINGVIKVAYNPNEDQTKVIYPSRINPVVSFRGEGVVIWGQKTLQSAASATDRMNVRQLMIFIANTVASFSRSTIFRQNDEFTRAQWRANVGPFLNGILQRRGIEDYKIVCDASNNPPEVTDRNEFQAYILIRPTTVAEFIKITIADVGGSLTINEALAGIKAT
jgi:phage tail sheath protein FI